MLNVASAQRVYRQQEGQIETQLEPEVAAARRGRERPGEATFSAGSDAPRFPLRAALTFDDGPDPLWTPRLLEALCRTNVRATFFVIAPLAFKHPRIVSAMLEAGHEIEFHCAEHVRHTHRSHHEVETDTREGLRALRDLGVRPRLWRPPWGVLAPWTNEVAESFELRLALWNADTSDWRGDTASKMLGHVEPLLGPGSVVLMHDGLGPGALRTGCEETVALVSDLVSHLRSMGCESAPLTLLPERCWEVRA